MKRRILLVPVMVAAVAGVPGLPAQAAGGATAATVSVGSPATITPPNHQNEPAVAVDASHPNILVAGSNDYIDQPICPRDMMAVNGSCDPRRTAAGLAAPYFSFDSGRTWTQPTYTGWTGRTCPPVSTCPGEFGPIGTLPWYYENGLVSGGDPAIAIGPKPGPGGFSWANGSRVYYSTLAAAVSKGWPNSTFPGFEAITVSRLDDPTPERVQQKSSWLPPVVIDTRSSQTSFEDKDQIWADNAESSRYFGRVYMCAVQYRSNGQHPSGNVPAPLKVSVSADGGTTWRTSQLNAASTSGNGSTEYGVSACTVRTTHTGKVYVFAQMFENAAVVGYPTHSYHVVFTSDDGGASWSRQQVLFRATDECTHADPVYGRCVMDGYAGVRTDLSGAPSIDIANGAPTGAGATDTIVDAWVEGTFNAEKVMVAYFRDGAWTTPAAASLPGDRPIYTAAAISPVGDTVYLIYQAATAPWRDDMTSTRPYHGIMLTGNGAGSWTLAYTGPTGDLRATYPGHDLYQERIGDYVYAAATRGYGVGVYIDASSAQVCDAIQRYRADSLAAGTRALPAPYPPDECPATFGNTDVVAATTG